MNKSHGSPCALIYYALCHEDVGGGECIDPRILYLYTT
jgi:hypothetical protein